MGVCSLTNAPWMGELHRRCINVCCVGLRIFASPSRRIPLSFPEQFLWPLARLYAQKLQEAPAYLAKRRPKVAVMVNEQGFMKVSKASLTNT